MEGEVQVHSAPAGGEMGFFGKFVNIFVNPHKAFVAIEQKPSWLIPMLILMVLTMIITYITYPFIIQGQLEAIRSNPNISAEQLEIIEQRMTEGGQSQVYFALGGQIIGFPIIYLAITGIFFFVGSVILGGNTSFKKLLAVYSWSTVIGVLSAIVRTPLVFVKENINVTLSPALLLSGDAVDSTLYNILSKFDFFVLWEFAVFAYGFGLIYKFSSGKSFATVGVLFGIYVVLAVVLSSMFKGFGF